ncbi:MAG: glycosyltransferase family 2 protein [Parasporobacterium sp.]|nr:glycosyltransferase family 2 protein [Parasporobacterium sp.]
MFAQILNIIALVCYIISGIYCLLILFFGIVGLVGKKIKLKPDGRTTRFAVMTCARNEEKVIGQLLDSISAQNYPRDCFDIFVVAHNCTDNTAEVSREHGATVFVRNAPEEKNKGLALHYGINCLREQFPGKYDAVTIFDSDNIAGRNYLTEVNKALTSGYQVVQGYRMSKNYHANWISELFGMFWLSMFHLTLKPQAILGMPISVNGTGFSFSLDVLGEEGWNTTTLQEDQEFSIINAHKGIKSIAIQEAVYYDEQPTEFKVAIQQRFRWQQGCWQNFTKFFLKNLAMFFKKPLAAFKVGFDLFVNVALIAGVIAEVIKLVAMICNGVFVPLVFMQLVGDFVACWVGMMFTGILTVICAKLRFSKNVRAMLLFPGYLCVSFVCAFAAIFAKKPVWVPIEHKDTTTLDDLETDK